MPLLLNTAGKIMLFGGKGLLIGSSPVPAPTPTSLPSSIAGLASWWDASTKPASGTSVASLPDKVGSAALAASATSAWIPRLAGALGGVGLEVTQLAGYSLNNWAIVQHCLVCCLSLGSWPQKIQAGVVAREW